MADQGEQEEQGTDFEAEERAADEAFVERMSKDEGKGAGRAGRVPAPAAGRTRPASAAAIAAAKAREAEDEDEGDDDPDLDEEGDEGDDGDDEGEAGGEEEREDEGDEEEGDEAGEEDGEEEGDEEGEEGEEEEGLDESLTEALGRHGARLTLDDIKDDKARALVAQRLKEMEAPFTRAMQEATEFRQERAKLRAELRFARENPVDYIVDLLLNDPNAADEEKGIGHLVNKRFDELQGSSTARKAHDVVVADVKKKALEAEQADQSELESRDQRAEAIETYARRAAKKAGIPFNAGVEEAIALHIITNKGDITNEQIDGIVRTKAKALEGTRRERKRERSRQYIDAKLKDRRRAGPAARPGRGVAPAPRRGAVPQTDEEFVEHAEAVLKRRGF